MASARRKIGALGSVAIGSALLLLSACGAQPEGPSTSTSPTAPVPAPAAAKIHGSLDEIGRICRQRKGQRFEARRLRQKVTRLLDFARRYPTARFKVHDESGTMFSALLVVRQELLSCDRDLVSIVEPAIERLDVEGLADPQAD